MEDTFCQNQHKIGKTIFRLLQSASQKPFSVQYRWVFYCLHLEMRLAVLEPGLANQAVQTAEEIQESLKGEW